MQVKGLDQQGEHHKVRCVTAQRQQVQGGIVGLICTGERFISTEPRRLVVKPGDMEDVQQHDEQAGIRACATHRTRSSEAEHEVSGSVMEAREAVKASGTRTAAVFLRFARGTEMKAATITVAEGLGEAGVHPHNAVRRADPCCTHHHDDVGAGVGYRPTVRLLPSAENWKGCR